MKEKTQKTSGDSMEVPPAEREGESVPGLGPADGPMEFLGLPQGQERRRRKKAADDSEEPAVPLPGEAVVEMETPSQSQPAINPAPNPADALPSQQAHRAPRFRGNAVAGAMQAMESELEDTDVAAARRYIVQKWYAIMREQYEKMNYGFDPGVSYRLLQTVMLSETRLVRLMVLFFFLERHRQGSELIYWDWKRYSVVCSVDAADLHKSKEMFFSTVANSKRLNWMVRVGQLPVSVLPSTEGYEEVRFLYGGRASLFSVVTWHPDVLCEVTPDLRWPLRWHSLSEYSDFGKDVVQRVREKDPYRDEDPGVILAGRCTAGVRKTTSPPPGNLQAVPTIGRRVTDDTAPPSAADVLSSFAGEEPLDVSLALPLPGLEPSMESEQKHHVLHIPNPDQEAADAVTQARRAAEKDENGAAAVTDAAASHNSDDEETILQSMNYQAEVVKPIDTASDAEDAESGVVAICGRCEAEVPQEARICPSCRAPLGEAVTEESLIEESVSEKISGMVAAFLRAVHPADDAILRSESAITKPLPSLSSAEPEESALEEEPLPESERQEISVPSKPHRRRKAAEEDLRHHEDPSVWEPNQRYNAVVRVAGMIEEI